MKKKTSCAFPPHHADQLPMQRNSAFGWNWLAAPFSLTEKSSLGFSAKCRKSPLALKGSQLNTIGEQGLHWPTCACSPEDQLSALPELSKIAIVSQCSDC